MLWGSPAIATKLYHIFTMQPIKLRCLLLFVSDTSVELNFNLV